MNFPNDFPVTRRWPPHSVNAIQLYTLNTPNGVKASIMLEECGLAYDAHRIDIGAAAEQKSPEFLSLNPNGKIPAMLDPHGPDGKPIALWESGAILIYLGDKTGKFLPAAGADRYRVLQWLMFQMGGVGPMMGQLGYFHKWAGREIEDKRPRDRYAAESRRLLSVLEGQMGNRDWIADDYSIADIALCPWINNTMTKYGAADLLGWDDFPACQAWIARFLDRPAVQRGLIVGA